MEVIFRSSVCCFPVFFLPNPISITWLFDATLRLTRWGCFNHPTQGRSTMLNISTLFYICFNSNSWYEEDLHFQFGRWHLIQICFATFLLIRFISSYIPNVSLLACLILEIAMKKTLNLGFGRQPIHNYYFLSIFHLIRLISIYIPKISLLACLILENIYEEDLKLGFEEEKISLNISSD